VDHQAAAGTAQNGSTGEHLRADGRRGAIARQSSRALKLAAQVEQQQHSAEGHPGGAELLQAETIGGGRRDALHLLFRQRFVKALHVAHAERAKQVADGAVDGEAFAPQQGAQSAVAAQQASVGEALGPPISTVVKNATKVVAGSIRLGQCHWTGMWRRICPARSIFLR